MGGWHGSGRYGSGSQDQTTIPVVVRNTAKIDDQSKYSRAKSIGLRLYKVKDGEHRKSSRRTGPEKTGT